MLDELAIINIIERMKSALFDSAPAIEHEWLALREHTFEKKSHAFFREQLVATLLEIDLSTAAGRRQIRRLITSLDQNEPLARSLEVLLGASEAKARSLRVCDVTQKNIHDLRDAMQRLDDLASAENDGLPGLFRRCGNPTAIVETVSKAVPYLKGLKIYTFLQQSAVPMAVPDMSRQRIMFRLGLWSETGQTRPRLLAFQELCQSVARLTGEPVGAIDLLMGLYSGVILRKKQFVPLCLAKPLCDECPVNGLCAYHRYRGSEPTPDLSRMTDMKKENRPREKFERLGPAQINDAELLAILLRTGAAGKSALQVATNLLRVFETLEGLEVASLNELMSVKGIGRGKAIEIKAALEMGKRLFTRPLSRGVQITCSSDVFNAYHLRFRQSKQEEFVLLCLDSKQQVIKESSISVGTLTQCLVHPRDVFKEAIRESAHAVIFVHNHPSGDPHPSHADILLTQRLKEAGEMLSIKILDHIVIGDHRFYSFTDHKAL